MFDHNNQENDEPRVDQFEPILTEDFFDKAAAGIDDDTKFSVGGGGGGGERQIFRGVATDGWKYQLLRRMNDVVPSFSDLFDEETFYLTALLFVVCTCLTAFILSRFITLRPCD